MIGQLIKITANKKLMVKIDKPLSRQISAAVHDAYMRRKFEYKGDRTVFVLDGDDEPAYFVLITLDKYDKLLLAKKFEPLVKKQVAIQYRMQHYDFAGDDGQVQGINLVLTNISKSKQQRETEAFEAVADEAAEAAEKRVIADAETKQVRRRRTKNSEDGQLGKLLDAMDDVKASLSECAKIENEIEEDDVAAQLAAVKSLRFDN
jgi:hypothetical protein